MFLVKTENIIKKVKHYKSLVVVSYFILMLN